jgi:hypothetical protein
MVYGVVAYSLREIFKRCYKMPVLLELFCGTKSIGKVFDQHGWDVVSVDMLSKFEPTICKNVLDLTPDDILKVAPGFSKQINCIWASPLCTQYSRARTTAKTPRDLEGSDKLVQKVLDLVKYFDVPFFMENPHSGLLKTRDVVQGVPMRVLDYCQYATSDFPGRYRKRTSIWTNTDWYPLKPLCIPSVCHFCTNGMTHDHIAQQRGRQMQRGHGTKQLYRIPAALPKELVDYVEKVWKNWGAAKSIFEEDEPEVKMEKRQVIKDTRCPGCGRGDDFCRCGPGSLWWG